MHLLLLLVSTDVRAFLTTYILTSTLMLLDVASCPNEAQYAVDIHAYVYSQVT